MSSSSEVINYDLRINKNIERKLIFESLVHISQKFDLQMYKYLGFGSLWFSDFISLHKIFGMKDMVSIEVDPIAHSRQNFNKPFDCIQIENGYSTDILATLSINGANLIAWLDYDGTIDRIDTLIKDIEFLVSSCGSGSVIIVTMNASHLSVKNVKDSEENDLDEVSAYRFYMADYADPTLKKSDLNLKSFVNTLSKSILSIFEDKVASSGRRMKFNPIYNYTYKDGVPMVTVGGMITDNKDTGLFVSLNLSSKHSTFCSPNISFIIAPPMTKKEVRYFNNKLPGGMPSTNVKDVSTIKKLHSIPGCRLAFSERCVLFLY